MGKLGEYLRNAREARDIDIRDAAQQTRISANYLKALEEEDFSKLPGEVFVRGFLKSYGRFLSLSETELLKKYAEMKPQPASPSASAADPESKKIVDQKESRGETPIEPFVWGAVIFISMLVLLFSSLPGKHPEKTNQTATGRRPLVAMFPESAGQSQPEKDEKIYLEIVAVEDTWLLVRTDMSPQKKAVLKKGESLIWSAADRFLVSFGALGAVKLLLNGEELAVQGTKETVVRDLAITRAGILNQPIPVRQPHPARQKQQAPQPQQAHTRPAAETRPPTPPAPDVRVSIPSAPTDVPATTDSAPVPAADTQSPPAPAPIQPDSALPPPHAQ